MENNKNFNETVVDLNTLLGSRLENVLDNFKESRPILIERLKKNRLVCDAKVAELSATNADEVNRTLARKISAIEETLANMNVWKSLTTKDGLKNSVRYIYSLCPSDRKRGPFLKERVAARILRAHPPVQLYAHVPASEVKVLSPLSIIAITRFTETKQWQDEYLSVLAKLSARHFTRREMRCLVIDSEAFAGVHKLAGEKQKPWRISHSKETGTIICFSLDRTHALPAPLTQYIAVFMHYFFETASAADFFTHIIKSDPSRLGLHIRNTIRSHEHKFDFFHPNSYSEHLFWEQAINLMTESFPNIPELQYFRDTIDCGGFISPENPESEIVSLNLIDHLWNVNLAPQTATAEYFGKNQKAFLYHFREGLWYDIFRILLGLSRDEKRKAIIEHLHLGDQPYTETLINRNAQ